MDRLIRCFLFTGLLVFVSSHVDAAVVVIGNSSDEPMPFTLKPDTAPAQEHRLAPGEARAYPCDASAAITFGPAAKPIALKLEAYTAYVFTNRNKTLLLTGIKLEGQSPRVQKLPTAAYSAKKITIPVHLRVDDSERRTQAAWEPVLRKRFTRAAEIVEAHTGVRFEIQDVGTWEADPKAVSLTQLHEDFEKVLKIKSGTIAIGYTSRRFDPLPGEAPRLVPFAAPVIALQSHLLIREREPRTEAERIEVLVQQLGKYLGAIVVPDHASVMRPQLGDGRAVQTSFHIGFDPLNVLAMQLTADELRTGKITKLADLSSATQTNLGRIYGTVQAATPDEPLPELYRSLIDRAGIRVAEAVAPAAGTNPIPNIPDPGRTRNAKEEAVRTVVMAITARAETNAQLRRDDPKRLIGDELTAAYIRIAATTAMTLEPDRQQTAFLLALGIGLDDSTVLRENPLTAAFCKAVESEDERRKRIAVLGNPTIHRRRDLCQHFVISAALTELAGAELAETAGLVKEQADMTRASGFSFTDLCADFSGIEFARLIKTQPKQLQTIGQKFLITNYVPSIEGLRDGISADRFKTDFVSTTNVKFQTVYSSIWERVKAMPVYRRQPAEQKQ